MAESKSQITETRSVISRKSQSTVSSRASMELLRAKAKAEGAQARATYALKEIQIKVEQARLQATLDALQAEKEKEVAIAEANSLEAGLIQLGLETRSEADISLRESQEQRTAQYVLEQTPINKMEMPSQPKVEDITPTHPHECVIRQQDNISKDASSDDTENFLQPPRNMTASQFAPLNSTHYTATPVGGNCVPTQPTYDLAKYLARSQLITSGLTNFDDQPMNYWAWKSSFKGAIVGLELSAGEELDLLIRYLGKNSSKQAKQIKAANIRSPAAGLTMAWERLEEIYGSPEAIEQALFNKVERPVFRRPGRKRIDA
ncbi:PREDICTED: uncharacterized protein LOC106909266 [Poecilia mexicana]|uniref:uncharacterized protein LOC106909266 n=1 Tax=Poecilia mexicana TaxID=48701 RepID=UPI00072DCEB6|nr:PREDICTED: uncharacterized protein LOC106909266 [Poecilia mexicana]